MSALEQRAVQSVIDKARSLGVDVPPEVIAICAMTVTSGARIYRELHPEIPDDDPRFIGCCDGAAYNGPSGCYCWEPVYDADQVQLEPAAPNSAADLNVQPTLCGDCAFRKDSKERADEWMEEALLALPALGEPFFCHTGMRRPIAYRHPTLGDVPADPDDWQPPMIGTMPFRLDGQPGLLCAGWMARRIRLDVAAGDNLSAVTHDAEEPHG